MRNRHPATRSNAGPEWRALILLPVLLIIPVLACRELPWNPWVVGGYAAGINLLTWFFYSRDKGLARSGRWRVPESTLHLVDLAGGWPAGFAAQRLLRHKTAKASYQVVFWVIVLAHQYLGLDYMLDWQISREIAAVVIASTGSAADSP